MPKKNPLIVALVGLNLVLAAALIFSLDLTPSAYAQRSGRPGDFAICTVKVHEDYDVVYVVDQQTRMLHCFVPTKGKDGKITHVQSRDLESDIKRTE